MLDGARASVVTLAPLLATGDGLPGDPATPSPIGLARLNRRHTAETKSGGGRGIALFVIGPADRPSMTVPLGVTRLSF